MRRLGQSLQTPTRGTRSSSSRGRPATQTAKHFFLFLGAPDARVLEEKLRPRELQWLVSKCPAIPWEEQGQPGSPGI